MKIHITHEVNSKEDFEILLKQTSFEHLVLGMCLGEMTMQAPPDLSFLNDFADGILTTYLNYNREYRTFPKSRTAMRVLQCNLDFSEEPLKLLLKDVEQDNEKEDYYTLNTLAAYHIKTQKKSKVLEEFFARNQQLFLDKGLLTKENVEGVYGMILVLFEELFANEHYCNTEVKDQMMNLVSAFASLATVSSFISRRVLYFPNREVLEMLRQKLDEMNKEEIQNLAATAKGLKGKSFDIEMLVHYGEDSYSQIVDCQFKVVEVVCVDDIFKFTIQSDALLTHRSVRITYIDEDTILLTITAQNFSYNEQEHFINVFKSIIR